MSAKKKTESADTTKSELTMAQRFTNAVVKSYGDVARGIEVTPKQMRVISNYYIKLDEMIRNPESKIQSWAQVRLPELATTLAHMAKLNLDMSLGQLSFMPFEHKNSNTFDLAPVISEAGYEYIAKTYGLEKPIHYIVELVYSTDKFSVTKRDSNHPYDTYTFVITNPFNRGKIVGGFGYLEYKDKTKNFVLPMSEQEILKYKPRWAKDSFWSGENGKKMYTKTIAKQLFKRVKLDPDKVNDIQDSFKRIESEELNFFATESKNEIDDNMCSGDVIDIEFESVPDDEETNVENPVENVENVNLLGDVIEGEV